MKYQSDLNITIEKNVSLQELTFSTLSDQIITIETSPNPNSSVLVSFNSNFIIGSTSPIIGAVLFLSSQDVTKGVIAGESIYIGELFIPQLIVVKSLDNYILTTCLIPVYHRDTIFSFTRSTYCIYDNVVYKNTSVGTINSYGVPFNGANWTAISMNILSDVYSVLNWCLSHKEIEIEFDYFVSLNILRTNANEMQYEITANHSFTRFNPTINFGDGTVVSSDFATHEYIIEDTYPITYTCYDVDSNLYTYFKNVYVGKIVVPSFSFSYNSSDQRKYLFTNLSKGDDGATYLWDFGDGTSSSLENPEHTYDDSLDGSSITVSLTISKNSIDYSTTSTVIIGYVSCSILYEEEYYTTDCHVFTMFEKDNTIVDRKLYLYDYLGNLISSFTLSSGSEELSFSVSNDGVYIAKLYTLTIDGVNDVLVKEFPVYTFCDAEECYYKIVEALLCCDTYCEDPCDLEAKELIYKMRNGLTRINSVLGLINKYVYLERNKYLGTIIIDATRRDYIYRVAKLQELLATTVNRCGECLENMPDTGECQTCNS